MDPTARGILRYRRRTGGLSLRFRTMAARFRQSPLAMSLCNRTQNQSGRTSWTRRGDYKTGRQGSKVAAGLCSCSRCLQPWTFVIDPGMRPCAACQRDQAMVAGPIALRPLPSPQVPGPSLAYGNRCLRHHALLSPSLVRTLDQAPRLRTVQGGSTTQ